MNILLLSAIGGGHSHLIPLYVLNQRYLERVENVTSYFLIPEKLHQSYKEAKINVLPIDFKQPNDANALISNYEGSKKFFKCVLSNISQAVSDIKPAIIIDDLEPLSTLIAEKKKIHRISIHRTGYFRSIEPEFRNQNHIHSMEKLNHGKIWDASVLLNPSLFEKQLRHHRVSSNLKCLFNYLNAKTKLIPGIASIERLPGDIKDRSSYFYTGPLLVKDNPSDILMEELGLFWDANNGRKTVFITTGLVDLDDIQDIVLHLLKNNYAVISTRSFNACREYGKQFIYIPFAPLNHICSKADLIIHQCGSGIYHYPLLHQKPAITLGTQCYDREDIAIRLQQLGVSRHVPSAKDDKNYLEIFTESLQMFENEKLCNYEQLKKLKDEIYRTMLEFDAEEMLEYTLNGN